ncbi:hypothetical protein K5V21_06265 [Clostridium sardiniense]|uniref:HTH merR-type domain-containing protein n=1 Tax=Clostridium sardiniense TaxID=29369 RepID=A0ABS7KW56_CLOSR|nr:hypothetical protein [Clostridium sardiniense]MBY0755056.1 hypothetical protein [Clostridium sardiniense]MDQ0459086.1 DNA-binding CsgD family transcriptional regulator [Clostridium sardiniense]
MYALYKGEKILCMGTIYQIAEALNIKVRTVQYYGTNANRRKIKKRNSKNSRVLVEI